MTKLLSVKLRFALFVSIAGCGLLQAQISPVRSLVEAERSFAAMSQGSGIKEAFVANLADDAVIFRPGPINGKEFWAKREATTARLEWHPAFADIAASGDLGYTMGPSLFTPAADLDQPPHPGYFFSLWKRTADGIWKVALDAGISTPMPEKNDTLVEYAPILSSMATTGVAKAPPVLLQLERTFSSLAEKRGMAAAYDRYLAADARMMRDDHFPFIGLAAIVAHLRKGDGKLSWTAITSRVANSLDLGYTYGKYKLNTVGAEETGHYVHVWKRQANGAWKVVVDVFQPMPKK